VAGQDPAAETAWPEGAPVTVTVSGPEPGTSIPAVLGLPEGAARLTLERLGITVVIAREPESVPADALLRSGKVWAQQPAEGAPADGAVTVWVNP
jgi:beta-lactam-binding protein with PASTA domain